MLTKVFAKKEPAFRLDNTRSLRRDTWERLGLYPVYLLSEGLCELFQVILVLQLGINRLDHLD